MTSPAPPLLIAGICDQIDDPHYAGVRLAEVLELIPEPPIVVVPGARGPAALAGYSGKRMLQFESGPRPAAGNSGGWAGLVSRAARCPGSRALILNFRQRPELMILEADLRRVGIPVHVEHLAWRRRVLVHDVTQMPPAMDALCVDLQNDPLAIASEVIGAAQASPDTRFEITASVRDRLLNHPDSARVLRGAPRNLRDPIVPPAYIVIDSVGSLKFESFGGLSLRA